MSDHLRGLDVARKVVAGKSFFVLTVSDYRALGDYTKALALHGRCAYDVSSRAAIDCGNTRCAIPADTWLPHMQRNVGPGQWQTGGWGHEGACVTWEGHSS